MKYVASQHNPSSQIMRGFFGVSPKRLFNDFQLLDERLRCDIGLMRGDVPVDTAATGSDTAPTGFVGPQIKIADIRRTRARAFALPLAITGSHMS